MLEPILHVAGVALDLLPDQPLLRRADFGPLLPALFVFAVELSVPRLAQKVNGVGKIGFRHTHCPLWELLHCLHQHFADLGGKIKIVVVVDAGQLKIVNRQPDLGEPVINRYPHVVDSALCRVQFPGDVVYLQLDAAAHHRAAERVEPRLAAERGGDARQKLVLCGVAVGWVVDGEGGNCVHINSCEPSFREI